MAEYTVAGVCYNKYEAALAKKLSDAISEWGKEKNIEERWYIADDDNPDALLLKRVPGTVREWTVDRFNDTDAIIYICSAVRAVRYIGKLLKDPMSDPAVLVIDASGRYCIPLLSGRRGEAYELARIFDSRLGIEFIDAVLPDDATQFDIEKYAQAKNMEISNSDYAKEVKAAISSGAEVGFYTNYPVLGDLPGGMSWATSGKLGVYISPSYHSAYFDHTLWLIPKCLIIGIRFEEGQSARKLEKAISELLKKYSLYPEAIAEIATSREYEHDISLAALCYERGIQLTALADEELKGLLREDGTAADICEAAAIKAGNGKLIINSVENDGITCAIAVNNFHIRF